MKQEVSQNPIILGIHPRTYGFGYVVFNGPQELIDWGLVRTKGLRKNAQSLNRVQQIIEFYQPDHLVIGGYRQIKSNQCSRHKRLIKALLELGKNLGIAANIYSPDRINAVFKRHSGHTAYQRAKLIVEWFPELKSRSPNRPQLWRRNDYRLGVFEAISLALTFYDHNLEHTQNEQSTIHA